MRLRTGPLPPSGGGPFTDGAGQSVRAAAGRPWDIDQVRIVNREWHGVCPAFGEISVGAIDWRHGACDRRENNSGNRAQWYRNAERGRCVHPCACESARGRPVRGGGYARRAWAAMPGGGDPPISSCGAWPVGRHPRARARRRQERSATPGPRPISKINIPSPEARPRKPPRKPRKPKIDVPSPEAFLAYTHDTPVWAHVKR